MRILHLEDEPKDALLVQAALEADGLEFERVHVATPEEFRAAIESGSFSVVLADFSVPGFDGLAALEYVRSVAPEVPFIFVSGAIGEETAIAAVRNGATDYVLKHRLSHLAPAVRRAVAEAEERERRRATEAALRASEEQLRQAQKLEAIGRLAGGVAHDFNNLLTVIVGFASLMRVRLQHDEVAQAHNQEILRAAERATGLTRQLLAFSRQQVLEPRVLDLNAVIIDLHVMLRRLIGEDVELVTEPAAHLGSVRADRGQLEQVLMNLVVNARDAMPQGGRLTIETAEMELDEGYAQARVDFKPGRYVMLAVSDTGCGMTDEIKARIFEPFFTTKEMGRGTGLGLSTVHGIVKQSEGHIEVYSELGCGTTFKVYLPRVEGAAGSVERPRTEPTRSRGQETVLVVEDEDLIRRVVCESLRSRGYSVLEARDGTEAIAICEDASLPLELLLTDVVMPLMSGPELAQRIESIRPTLPVLYMSGYTDRALIHQGLRREGSGFIQKPFTPDVLANAVREHIDGARRRAA
jgi:signal transduction histidine kinase